MSESLFSFCTPDTKYMTPRHYISDAQYFLPENPETRDEIGKWFARWHQVSIFGFFRGLVMMDECVNFM